VSDLQDQILSMCNYLCGLMVIKSLTASVQLPAQGGAMPPVQILKGVEQLPIVCSEDDKML